VQGSGPGGEQYEERTGETDLLISLFPIGRDSIVTSGVDISVRTRMEAEVRRLLEVSRAERERLSAVLNAVSEEVYSRTRRSAIPTRTRPRCASSAMTP
jgi:hypothetical protein